MILGLKWPFLKIIENVFFHKKQQNRKIQRSAFILAIHKQNWANEARFMSSNECSSIWDQSGLFSSIRLEMRAQKRKKIGEISKKNRQKL